jgi:NTE family protein
LSEIAAIGIEPTQHLGALAAQYVVSKKFAKRSDGAAGRLLRWLADSDPLRAGDLLGYLMFDGGFTEQLYELGRADARAKHDEICALFT